MNILAGNRDTGMCRADWLANVYQAVDGVLARGEGAGPPGAAGRLHRAIDALKAQAPDDAFVARAEEISVTVHRLQAALCDPGRDTVERRLRTELGLLGREWIEATPLFR